MRRNFYIFIGILLGSSLTHGACYVNADLNCPAAPGLAWTGKSILARVQLLYSSPVQTDIDYCEHFARIIKTECGIQAPVQYVFVDELKTKSMGLLLNSSQNPFENLASLPTPFANYYNDNGLEFINFNYNQLLSSIGKPSASALFSFIEPQSTNDFLKIPMGCGAVYLDRKYEYTVETECGHSLTCGSSNSDKVPDLVEIKKIPGSRTCSPMNSLQAILEKLNAFAKAYDGTRVITSRDQPEVTNFSAFTSMPILEQSGGWIQGLSLDKYGEDYTKPGICLGTSMTMMALALKDESPLSQTQSLFDVKPNEYGDGTAKVKSGQTLQYSKHATYIDEMLRIGGVLSGPFPAEFRNFNHFFHKGISLDPSGAAQVYVGGVPFGHFEHYLENKPKQDYMETQLPKFISSKTGVVLGLQSLSYVVGVEAQTEGRIGHANTVRGYSGNTIILHDPWGVVNQVQFSDHQVAKTFVADRVVTQSDYDRCIASLPVNAPQSVVDLCFRPGTLLGTDTRVYRALVHVGAPFTGTSPSQRAYIGVPTIQGTPTAAYIIAFQTAKPWPQRVTADGILSEAALNNPLVQRSLTGQGCTAATQGEIVVNGKKYFFTNPMPFLKPIIVDYREVPSTTYASSTPVKTACTNLFESVPDGSIAKFGAYLLGTFEYTCTNGAIAVTSNSCRQPEPEICTESIPNSSLARRITLAGPRLGLITPNDRQTECRVQSCNKGFTRNTTTNSCECTFTESQSGQKLAGTVTGEGSQSSCQFLTQNCPAGKVLVGASPATSPACVDTTSTYTTAVGAPVPTYPVKDAKGNSLWQLAKNATYSLDSNGVLVFKSCNNASDIKVVGWDGAIDCVSEAALNPATLTEQLALTKRISTGKIADGICAPGFLLDYDKKYCVASLTSCNYAPGAMGLRTFDPDSPESCRFMGCIEGYRTLKFEGTYTRAPSRRFTPQNPNCRDSYNCPGTTEETLFDPRIFNRYYCAPDSSYSVSADRTKIIKDGDENKVVWSYGNSSSPELSSEDDILRMMNLNTNLDCSRVPASEIGACQTLASAPLGDLSPAEYVGASTITDVNRVSSMMSRAQVPNSIPLGTFNCGGPDSMATEGTILPFSNCMSAWSEKVKVLGQCYVPNGKGYIAPGKGCLVESCFPGFSPNPTNRACLDLGAPCFRHDLPVNSYEAYLAEVSLDGSKDNASGLSNFEGIGRFSACMIKSCKGTPARTYVEVIKPVTSGYSGNDTVLALPQFLQYEFRLSDYLGGGRPVGYPYNRPMYSIFSSQDKEGENKEKIQYTDLCLQDAHVVVHNTNKDQNYIRGVPGAWCRSSTGVQGVLSYTGVSGDPTSLLPCAGFACPQETAFPDTYYPTGVNSLGQKTCVKQPQTSPISIDYCYQGFSNFVSLDRRRCLTSPLNFTQGDFKYGSQGPSHYLIDPPSFLGFDQYGRILFNRYLPRFRGTTFNVEYFDIVSKQTIKATDPAPPGSLSSNLNWHKVFFETPPSIDLSRNPITGLLYDVPNLVLAGSNIDPIQPQVFGGRAKSFKAVPELSTIGLHIDSETGVISGVPLEPNLGNSSFLSWFPSWASQNNALSTNFTISAENEAGSFNASVQFRVGPEPIKDVIYDLHPVVFGAPFKFPPRIIGGRPLSARVESSPGQIASFVSVDADLNLSGTLPVSSSGLHSYRIIFSNPTNSITKDINFSISSPARPNQNPPTDARAPFLAYEGRKAFQVGVQRSWNPVSFGGPVSSVVATLPAGLSMSSTGTITGSPTEAFAFRDINFSATGPGGTQNSKFTLGSFVQSPRSLGYSSVYPATLVYSNQTPGVVKLKTINASPEKSIQTCMILPFEKIVNSDVPPRIELESGPEWNWSNRLINSTNPLLKENVTVTPGTLAISPVNGQITGTLNPGVLYTIEARNAGGFNRLQFCALWETTERWITKELIYDINPQGQQVPRMVCVGGVSYPDCPMVQASWDKLNERRTLSHSSLTNPNAAGYQTASLSNMFDTSLDGDRYTKEVSVTNGRLSMSCTRVAGVESCATATSIRCDTHAFQDFRVFPNLSCVECFADDVKPIQNGVVTTKCNNGSWDAITSNSSQIACNGGFELFEQKCVPANQAPSGLSYPTVPKLARGLTMKPVKPSFSGGKPLRFFANRDFPLGLTLNEQTGEISGVPRTASPRVVYTVTAENNFGASSADVAIEVSANLEPKDLSYPGAQGLLTLHYNFLMTPLRPVSFGGNIERYSITPDLPIGVSLDPISGEISGTPDIYYLERTKYVISGSNRFGSAATYLELQVVDPPPQNLAYNLKQKFFCGKAIDPILPTADGPPVHEFKLVLPDGLTGLIADAGNGQLTGTPDGNCKNSNAISVRHSLIFSAENPGGKTIYKEDIEIFPLPPASLSYTIPASFTLSTQAFSPYRPTVSGGVPVEYSVSPSLPSGFNLNPNNGEITGAPLALIKTNSYTITAKNAGGAVSTTIDFEVRALPPSNLVYPAIPALTRNSPMTPVTPTVGGGKVGDYYTPDALPAGVFLDSVTGVLSGIPTLARSSSSVRIRARNPAGETETSVQISVVDLPLTGLRYQSPILYTFGKAINPNRPIYVGGSPPPGTTFRASTALPTGISVNSATGELTGTPQQVVASRSYTIQGFRSGESLAFVSAQVSLGVVAQSTAPTLAIYRGGPFNFVVNESAPNFFPDISGGQPTEYWVTPDLPQGLSIHPTEGRIYGTPTESRASFEYTLHAQNASGKITSKFFLSVEAPARTTAVKYDFTFYVFNVGQYSGDLRPIVTGGSPSQYTISPALPLGLSLDPSTGLIRGTPVTPWPRTIYRITARNSATSTAVSFDFSIAVNNSFSGIARSPTTIEAETSFQVAANVGPVGAPTVDAFTQASAGRAIVLYDAGDSVNIPINITQAGKYYVGLRVRSSGVFDTTNYDNWLFFRRGGYSVQLGARALTLVGDGESLVLDAYGDRVFWGLMKAPPVHLTVGTHQLKITTDRPNAAIDSIIILPETQVFEAETGYQIISDAGSNAIRAASGSLASQKQSLLMLDTGDKVKIRFSLPHWGYYTLGVRLRAGDNGSSSGYFNGGYKFTLNGQVINLTGDPQSISAKQPEGGGVFWGSMTSLPFKLGAGNYELEVEALRPWAMIDALTLSPILTPQPSGTKAYSVQNVASVTSKSLGGVLAPNSALYFAPFGTNRILKYRAAQTVAPELLTYISVPETGFWGGGVLTDNGRIFFMPQETNRRVLMIDTRTDTVSLVGAATGATYMGATVAGDGMIYAFPDTGETKVLKINPKPTVPVVSYAATTTGVGWSASVLAANGNIYGVPKTASSVIELNPNTNAVTYFGSTGAATSPKWNGGIINDEGNLIFAAPTNAAQMLVIDTENRRTALYPIAKPTDGLYMGITRAKDGSLIFGTSAEGLNAQYFDPNFFKTVDLGQPTTWKTLPLTSLGVTGDCRWPAQDVFGGTYCAPGREGTTLRKININTPMLNWNPMLPFSPFYNR